MRYTALVWLILVVTLFGFLFQFNVAEALDIYQPELSSVNYSPSMPSPLTNVSVSATVRGQFEIRNVTLFYSVNGGNITQNTMRLSSGNLTNGIWLGMIPAQPVDRQVSYYVIAEDQQGYSAVSSKISYSVFQDREPPHMQGSLYFIPRVHMDWDYTTIGFSAVDDGSGVRNVTLYYTTNETAPYKYNELAMRLTEGDMWKGRWEAQIPPQPVGTHVSGYYRIVDNSGNPYQSRRPEYPEGLLLIQSPNDPEASFSVQILDIDLENLTATIKIDGRAYLPSKDFPARTSMIVDNEWTEESITWREYFDLKPTDQRFELRFTGIRRTGLLGDSRNYPFEQYFLNLTIPLPMKNIRFDEPDILVYNQQLRATWERQGAYVVYQDEDQTVMNLKIDLSRKPNVWLPIFLPVLAAFLTLGSTPLLRVDKNLEHRLTIYLALFVFSTGYLFTISPLQPFTTGLTVLFTLTLILMGATALLVLSSVIGFVTKWKLADLFVLAIISLSIFPVTVGPNLGVLNVGRLPFPAGLLLIGTVLYGIVMRWWLDQRFPKFE